MANAGTSIEYVDTDMLSASSRVLKKANEFESEYKNIISTVNNAYEYYNTGDGGEFVDKFNELTTLMENTHTKLVEISNLIKKQANNYTDNVNKLKSGAGKLPS